MESNNFKEASFKYLCQSQSYQATQPLLSDCSFNQLKRHRASPLFKGFSLLFSTVIPIFSALIMIIHPSSIGEPLLSLCGFSMLYIQQIFLSAFFCARYCGFSQEDKIPAFMEPPWDCQPSENKAALAIFS